jgi:cysteine desulfurase / selenocysteine lyase
MTQTLAERVAQLRADFPLLQRRVDGKPLIYLDSAATALKPHAVLQAQRAYEEDFTANIHRGQHLLSEEASSAYENARRRVASFLKTTPQSIVFVKNATEALNTVARGMGLNKSDRVLASISDHHSLLLPWMREASLLFLERDPLAPLDPQAVLDSVRRHHPRALLLSHASNVTGIIEPMAEICALCKPHGVTIVVDATQTVAHLPLDVGALGCDFLAFSGHKMLGPTGTGVLWGAAEPLEKLDPLTMGGGAVQRVLPDGYELKECPYRFEAGTPNISGVLGLAAAIDYIDALGFETIAAHDQVLADRIARETADIPGMHTIMSPARPRLAIAQVVLDTPALGPEDLSLMLSDGYKIMTRAGFHCVHLLFDHLALARGAVRVSAYVYNTEEEIAELGGALRSILGRFDFRRRK